MDASGERFAYRERRTGAWARRPGDPVSISVWSTSGPVNRLVEFRNGTIRREAGLDRPTTIGRPVGDHVHTVFSGFDVDVIDRGDANGTTRFVLEATDVSSTGLPLFPAPHGTADIRAVVSESGLVRTIQVEAVSRRGRLTLHLIWTVRYSAVGETVITPPRLNDTAEDGP